MNLATTYRANVLVVEPRPLLGSFMTYVLGTLRLRGVGPFSCPSCARAWLDSAEEPVGAALVSTSMPDSGAFDLAGHLATRGIPVGLVSKPGVWVPWEYRDLPVISLPYSAEEVREAVFPLLRTTLRLELRSF